MTIEYRTSLYFSHPECLTLFKSHDSQVTRAFPEPIAHVLLPGNLEYCKYIYFNTHNDTQLECKRVDLL